MGLTADLAVVRTRASELIAAGKDRDLTEQELTEVEELGTKAETLTKAIERSRKSQEQLRGIEALAPIRQEEARDLNGKALDGNGDAPRPIVRHFRSPAEEFILSNVYKEFRGRFPGGRIPDGASVNTPPALITGGLVKRRGYKTEEPGGETGGGDGGIPPGTLLVSQPHGDPQGLRELVEDHDLGLQPSPLWVPTILGLITQSTTTSDLITFARATASVTDTENFNRAGYVGEGEIKPQSTLGFERAQTPVETLAHWIAASKIALADVGQLRTLIDQFLIGGLQYRVEQEIINGNGEGPNGGLVGIMNTPNLQTATGALIPAVRNAITMLSEYPANSAPTAVVLNPVDSASVDLMTDQNGAFFGGGPFAMGPNVLWGLPRITTPAMPEGEALVGDFRQAVLWNRQQDTLSFSDSHADFFIRNLVVVLGERRLAFAVMNPLAFVHISFTDLLAHGAVGGSAPIGEHGGHVQHGGGTTGSQAPTTPQTERRRREGQS